MTSRARTAALALVGLAVAGPVLVASADARAAACPAGSWRATFFNSTTFGGGPVLSRCDAGVAFDWGTGRPGPGVRADGFTARWARTATFAAGTYTFTAAGDEGVRVKVDGTLVLNAWRTTPGRPVEASVRLAAGSHTVVVEHREATGAASVSASYRLASATPTSANLLSNPDLADGAPLPACFADGGYGQRPATGALSIDVPAGAAGRSWRIEQTAYVDGDAKLVSSDAPGCVGDLDPGATYTLGVSYRSSMPVNSLPLYAYRVGSGWSYWTTLTTLPPTCRRRSTCSAPAT